LRSRGPGRALPLLVMAMSLLFPRSDRASAAPTFTCTARADTLLCESRGLPNGPRPPDWGLYSIGQDPAIGPDRARGWGVELFPTAKVRHLVVMRWWWQGAVREVRCEVLPGEGCAGEP
jgi:hypothetical protein